eukprot:6213147-Pleurochrysis_carterae.AAC.1
MLPLRRRRSSPGRQRKPTRRIHLPEIRLRAYSAEPSWLKQGARAVDARHGRQGMASGGVRGAAPGRTCSSQRARRTGRRPSARSAAGDVDTTSGLWVARAAGRLARGSQKHTQPDTGTRG